MDDLQKLMKEGEELLERLNPSRPRMYGGFGGKSGWMSTDWTRNGVAKAYRENWDGVRDMWKEGYRKRKALKLPRL